MYQPLNVRITDELAEKIASDMKKLGINDKSTYVRLMLSGEIPGLADVRKAIRELKYAIDDMVKHVEAAANHAASASLDSLNDGITSVESEVSGVGGDLSEIKEKLEYVEDTVGHIESYVNTMATKFDEFTVLSARIKDVEQALVELKIRFDTKPDDK